MRIFLNGIGAFGADVFRRLVEEGHEIVTVAAPANSLSGRPDQLYVMAQSTGIPALDVSTIRSQQALASLTVAAPDLGVMAFVQKFIPMSILKLPRHGTIQYHPSLLPKHRGRSAINWAIISGETTTGASIFWPDEGIDTGPLLTSREVEIGPDDTAGSLYREKLYPLGVNLLAEAVRLVEKGSAPQVAQNETEATYEPPCEGHWARVDWSRPVADVHNLIRGCEPSPGAWTVCGEHRLRLLGSFPMPAFVARPGEVVSVGDDGMIVGVADGAVRLTRLQTDGPAVPAQQVASELNILPGMRFPNPNPGDPSMA